MAQVELDVSEGVATLTFNRPDALNALSSSVLEELDTAVGRIESDAAIHGAIVTGAGRAFVAGADISEIAELDRFVDQRVLRRDDRGWHATLPGTFVVRNVAMVFDRYLEVDHRTASRYSRTI